MEKYVDNEQESVTKTFEGEKKKLAQMTTGEKAEYIFTYYKVHIMLAIAAILVIAYIIHNRLTYVEYKLYGVVINSADYNESLEKEMPELLGMGKHEGFSLTGGLSGDVDSNTTSYYNQIDLYTVSGQMDFAFTDEAGAQYLCDLGTPWDVTVELPAELMSMWDGRQVEFNQRNLNDDEYFANYAAINITGTKVHDYFGLDDNMCYLLITGYPAENEYMDDFYQLLIDVENGNLVSEN